MKKTKRLYGKTKQIALVSVMLSLVAAVFTACVWQIGPIDKNANKAAPSTAYTVNAVNESNSVTARASGATVFENAVQTYITTTLAAAYQSYQDVTSTYASRVGFRCNKDNTRYLLTDVNTDFAVIENTSTKNPSYRGYYVIVKNSSVFPDYSGCTVAQAVLAYNGKEVEKTVLTDFPIEGYLRFYADSTFQNAVTLDITYTFPVTPFPEDPVKEGHTFTGWYNGKAEDCNNLCAKYTGTGIFEDMQLHAHWDINRYTVTFRSDGGSPVSPMIANWNTAITCPVPTRVGYDFIEWRLPDGAPYTDQPIKADVTLTAVWKIKTFTVTFYVDGEVYAEQTVEYGSSLGKAMENANIASYKAMNMEGERLSKQNTVISEDTQVTVQKLTGWEKYGDFVARNPWYTWVAVAFGGVLLIVSVASIITVVKGR